VVITSGGNNSTVPASGKYRIRGGRKGIHEAKASTTRGERRKMVSGHAAVAVLIVGCGGHPSLKQLGANLASSSFISRARLCRPGNFRRFWKPVGRQHQSNAAGLRMLEARRKSRMRSPLSEGRTGRARSAISNRDGRCRRPFSHANFQGVFPFSREGIFAARHSVIDDSRGHKRLQGCIQASLTANEPWEEARSMALTSAAGRSRFRPLEDGPTWRTSIEISVLSHMETIGP